nr:MAG TPA: hypothetical protein [Caudoviricetes sp.]
MLGLGSLRRRKSRTVCRFCTCCCQRNNTSRQHPHCATHVKYGFFQLCQSCQQAA